MFSYVLFMRYIQPKVYHYGDWLFFMLFPCFFFIFFSFSMLNFLLLLCLLEFFISQGFSYGGKSFSRILQQHQQKKELSKQLLPLLLAPFFPPRAERKTKEKAVLKLFSLFLLFYLCIFHLYFFLLFISWWKFYIFQLSYRGWFVCGGVFLLLFCMLFFGENKTREEYKEKPKVGDMIGGGDVVG